MRPTLIALAVALLVPFAACKSAGPRPAAVVKDEARTAPPLPSMDIDQGALDREADPCDDFYQFACGGWIAATPIPPDRPGWYRSFSEIQAHNELMLRRILEDSAAGRLKTPYGEKLGAYWTSCMDEEHAPKASLATLQVELARIDAVQDRKQLATEVARLQFGDVNAFFAFGAEQDFRDATQMIGGADQGGLGLPDRDYYLKEDERAVALRQAYQTHVARMLELAGEESARAAADAQMVMEIETALAAASLPRVERRDPYAIYHRIDRKGLEAQAPAFDWKAYFDALGIGDIEAINVAVPAFFAGFNQVLVVTELPALRAYLRWHLVDTAAPALPEAFVQEDFDFSAAHLTGEEQILPRWKRCVAAVDGAMGEALARPFVEETFGPEGKSAAVALVKGIEEAFRENLDTLDWMDETTRKGALEKLHTIDNKIGYPDHWRNYDALKVERVSYLENRLQAARFESRRQLAQIGKPVDRSEWFMSPPTVNAYYNPLLNEMVFPAGILQSPFFRTAAAPAANAGAIGMVMGHELSHGFDDKGRLFDAEGNLRDWWSPEVAAAYTEKTQCVVQQYDAYTVLDGVHLNGNLTLGENIADSAGLRMSWKSFSAGRTDLDEEGASGFTPAQHFFLSYAQAWCSNRRPAYERMLVTVDPHSPPIFRVNGAVSNQAAFQEAFQCEAGSPMAPVDRCVVW